MKLPILKYYLSAPFSLKLRCYFERFSEGFFLTHSSLEQGNRACLECLIYAPVDACDPSFLSSVEPLLQWLNAYLAKKPTDSLPPLCWPETPFSLLTLQQLAKIPFGSTATYQELATRMGHPKAFRAVGTALNKNPFALLLPCHRIVSKKDGLGGFAYSLSLKTMLLDFERAS